MKSRDKKNCFQTDPELQGLWSEELDPTQKQEIFSALNEIGNVQAPLNLKYHLKDKDTYEKSFSFLGFKGRLAAGFLAPAVLVLLIVFFSPSSQNQNKLSDESLSEDSFAFVYGNDTNPDDLFPMQILDDELYYLEDVL
jgi:hypothetical protein